MATKFILLNNLVFILIGLTIQTAQAAPQGMSEEQMQQMMKQAEEMQKCYGNIDQSFFKNLETKGKKMEAEVKALCKAGKRDKAQDTAMKFGKEMAASKEIQAMKKCGAMAEQMMAQMPMMTPDMTDKSAHVCDGI